MGIGRLCTVLVEACVFGAHPGVAVHIPDDLADGIAADGVAAVVGEIFAKNRVILRVVIDAAEKGAGPKPAFLVAAERIYRVIGQGVRIMVILLQVNGMARGFIIYKKA